MLERFCAAALVLGVVGGSVLPTVALAQDLPFTQNNGVFQINVTKSNAESDVDGTPKRHSQFKSQHHAIVIDTMHRVLGGDKDLAFSANKQLPTQKFPFTTPSSGGSGPATLTIGTIYGINTPEAHADGTNTANHISAPVVIKVNGKRVHYVYRNGQDIHIKLPSYALSPSGLNVIQVEAGYYFPAENQIAYDEVHLQNLALDFQ